MSTSQTCKNVDKVQKDPAWAYIQTHLKQTKISHKMLQKEYTSSLSQQTFLQTWNIAIGDASLKLWQHFECTLNTFISGLVQNKQLSFSI